MALASPQPAQAQALEGPASTAVCVYQDRTFSVGAAVCPHARFMLMCMQENDKLTWKIVSDPSLSNRCLASTFRSDPPAGRKYVRRTAAVRPAPPVAAAGAAKCFTFNNRQYCE